MSSTRGYGPLLRTSGALAFTVAALVGRLPIAMLGIGTVLLVEDRRSSYALAGLVSASYAAGTALLGPALSRLVDRLGQRRVLPRRAGGDGGRRRRARRAGRHLGAGLGAAGLRARDERLPEPARARACAAAGAGRCATGGPRSRGRTPGRPSSTRSSSCSGRSSSSCARRSTRRSACSPRSGSAPPGRSPSSRCGRPSRPSCRSHEGAGRSALASAGLRTLTVSMLCVGVLFGTSRCRWSPSPSSGGARPAAGCCWHSSPAGARPRGCSTGRCTGGRRPAGAAARDLFLALGLVPLLFAPTVAWMAPAALLAGFAISPVLIVAFGLVEDLVPPAARTEGFSLAQLRARHRRRRRLRRGGRGGGGVRRAGGVRHRARRRAGCRGGGAARPRHAAAAASAGGGS